MSRPAYSALRRTLLALLLTCASCNLSHAYDLHLVTEDFPPFNYPAPQSEPGEHAREASGPIPEVIELLCQQLHWQCLIELYPWKRAQSLAERDSVDGMFSVVRSPEREQHFHFTPMLVSTHYSVFTTYDSSFTYQQPSDLKNRMIGVYGPSGTSYTLAQHLANAGPMQLHLTPDNRRLLRMLESGRFGPNGVVVINRDVARSLIASEQLSNIREAGELSGVEYGIALSKHRISAERFALIERSVKEAQANGSIERILRRYNLTPAAQQMAK